MAIFDALPTRDNQIWNILLWVGSVSLALSTITNPAEYGIPASFIPYLRLLALVMTAVGGKNATSKRPHSEEGDAKITASGE